MAARMKLPAAQRWLLFGAIQFGVVLALIPSPLSAQEPSLLETFKRELIHIAPGTDKYADAFDTIDARGETFRHEDLKPFWVARLCSPASGLDVWMARGSRDVSLITHVWTYTAVPSCPAGTRGSDPRPKRVCLVAIWF